MTTQPIEPSNPGPAPASGAHQNPAHDGVPSWAKGLGLVAAGLLTTTGGGFIGASQASVDAAKERAVTAAQVERLKEDVRDIDEKIDELGKLIHELIRRRE